MLSLAIAGIALSAPATSSSAASPILLVDNGSRRPASRLALREGATAFSALLGGRDVRPTSLGFSDGIDAAALGGVPARTLRTELEGLLADGAPGATVVPLFLGPSGGLQRGVASCARELVAGTSFELRVGACLVDASEPCDGRVGRALAAQVLRVARRARLRQPLKVLVIDHGTPSPSVHAVRERLAAEVRALLGPRALSVTGASMERRDEPAYDFNEPLLERALARPPYDGGDVVLAMAFLLPGRHAGEGGDVAQIVERAQEEAAAEGGGAEGAREPLRVHTTPLLGGHSLVLDVLAERVRQAEGGEAESGEGARGEEITRSL